MKKRIAAFTAGILLLLTCLTIVDKWNYLEVLYQQYKVAGQVVFGYNYQLPVQTYTAVSTPTTGFNVSSSGAIFHILTWAIVGGTLSGCQISVDSATVAITGPWTTGGIIAAQTCTSNGSFITTAIVPTFIRINLSTFTVATGTPSLVVTLTGSISAGTTISISGGSFTAAQPIFGSASTGVQSSPSWYYISYPVYADGGGDVCKTINNAIISITANGTINLGSQLIYDIPGQVKCLTNPWAGNAANWIGELSIPVSVAFFSATSWIQPSNSLVVGSGFAATGDGASNGSVIVACYTGASVALCPGGAFPNDTPLYCFINCTYNFNYSGAGKDTQLWQMTLDCAYVQGCRTFMNYYTQENSGVFFSYLDNWNNNGIGLDIGSSSSNGGTANGSYFNLAIQSVNGPASATQLCTVGALAIRENYTTATSAGAKSIQNITATHFNCAETVGIDVWPLHLIEVNGGATQWVGNIHTEYFGDAAIVVGSMTDLGSVTTSNGALGACAANCMQLVTNANGTSDPFRVGISTAGTAVYINNVSNTITSCQSATICTLGSAPGTNTDVPYSFENIGQAGCTQGTTGASCVYGAQSQSFGSLQACCGWSSGGTQFGTPTMIKFISGSNTANIAVGNILNQTGSCSGQSFPCAPPVNNVVDQFNNTILRSTVFRMGCYTIDSGDNVTCDDSGINSIFYKALIKGPGFLTAGTKFTTNAGCSEVAANNVGTATAGRIITVGLTSCTTIVTMGLIDGTAATATHTWSCHANDKTTPGDFNSPTMLGTSATTATITSGTIVAGDTIEWGCTGY